MNLSLLTRFATVPWAIRRELLPMIFTSPREGVSPTEKKALASVPGFVPLCIPAADALAYQKMPSVRAGVTVLMIWGILGRAFTEMEKWWLDAVDVDELTRAVAATPEGETVVLWFRCPGGIITGVPETAAALRKLGEKRNIVSFSDDLCASAAYWLAAQTSKITATPTAEIGSIGVYLAYYDYCEYMKKSGISLELFKSGDMKGTGLPGNPLNEKEREHLNAGVLQSFADFRRDVLRNREIPDEAMQGQCMRGKSAQNANLVDGFTPSAADFFTRI